MKLEGEISDVLSWINSLMRARGHIKKIMYRIKENNDIESHKEKSDYPSIIFHNPRLKRINNNLKKSVKKGREAKKDV